VSLIHDLAQATVIMVLGMSVTFIFLAVLILAIHVSSKIITKYTPEPSPLSLAPKPISQAKGDGAVVAAITIAVKKYHNDKKRKI